MTPPKKPKASRRRAKGNRIKALVFDFDGLIVDTEVPIFRAWQRIYREHGQELPLDRWLTIIGTSTGDFAPVRELGDRLGEKLDEKELDALARLYYLEATALQQLLPGVADYLAGARKLGLKTGVASSSSRKWVMEHLERFGIARGFDAIICREDVKRTKPDPELYRRGLRRLEVKPSEAMAVGDSSNGIHAAKGAGLFWAVGPHLRSARSEPGAPVPAPLSAG